MKRVNLRDIAARAGVSPATVSLALRGRGMVARATAERVRALAHEMGYRPNPLFAALAWKQFRSEATVDGTPLAIFSFPVLPDGSGPRAVYPRHLVPEARKLGYAPKVYHLTSASNSATVFRELYHRTVPGIIITGSMDMETFGQGFDWDRFAVVECGRYHTTHQFHTVRPNIFQALKMAFMQLRERGYERIGFALGRHDKPIEDDHARYGAAIAFGNNCLPRRHRLPVYNHAFSDEESFLKWFDKYQPEVVVGFSVKQYWALKNHGVRVPEDVGFVGLHVNVQDRAGIYSGLHQNHVGIARQSVITLDQLIRNREQGPATEALNILVSSRWHEGKTLRKAGLHV
jgi:DNA-binding LacI/PurR family transcriptional regulator